MGIEIDNSLDAAVKSGSWGNPGSSFYNKLLECDNYSSLLNEAYLECGDVDKDTPFSRSGCKYPHHVISGDKLVVSIPGIKAAYSRAKQMGVFSGEIKSHLEKHYREMDIYNDSTMAEDKAMKENFEYIENTINNILGTDLYEEDTSVFDIDDSYINEAMIPYIDIKTPEELFKYMERNISYEYLKGNMAKWRLREPKKLFKDGKGICHDQSLYELEVLKRNGYKCGQVFFIEADPGSYNDITKMGNSHTLTWFEENKKLYWFEHSWENHYGIHGPYRDLDMLKSSVYNNWKRDDDLNSKKYKGIVMFTEPHYKTGMNIGQYIHSWIGDRGKYYKEYTEDTIESLSNWIERFVYDDYFRESFDYYEEKKSNLKFDYRFAIDIDTGHKLKIIYLIGDKMYLKNNYELRDDGKYSLKVGEEGIKDMKKNGSTDHESSNQKVVAIIDTVTGDKLTEAKTKGMFPGISSYTDDNPHIIKVDEIDKKLSFKSTFMGHERNDKEDLVARERTPHMRGMKGRHMDPGDKLYDQKYVDRYIANEERKRREKEKNATH